MSTTTTLIIVISLAWGMQILLGYLQIRCFNKHYTDLAKEGTYIGIGKSSGRFKPKVLIIIALDAEKKVMDSILMQGLTVFAKPKTLSQLHGMSYKDIDAKSIFPTQKRHCEALQSALSIKE